MTSGTHQPLFCRTVSPSTCVYFSVFSEHFQIQRVVPLMTFPHLPTWHRVQMTRRWQGPLEESWGSAAHRPCWPALLMTHVRPGRGSPAQRWGFYQQNAQEHMERSKSLLFAWWSGSFLRVCCLLREMQVNILVKQQDLKSDILNPFISSYFHAVNTLLDRTSFVSWLRTVCWRVKDKYWSFYLSEPLFPPLENGN